MVWEAEGFRGGIALWLRNESIGTACGNGWWPWAAEAPALPVGAMLLAGGWGLPGFVGQHRQAAGDEAYAWWVEGVGLSEDGPQAADNSAAHMPLRLQRRP